MKIAAITYYRFDADYLDDYRANLADLCDEFVMIEDTEGRFMHDEARYRTHSYDVARGVGADWAVVLDPDERIETRAIPRLRRTLATAWAGNRRQMFQLNYRELYTPRQYRTDGIWGAKRRIVIFPLLDGNVYSEATLHMPKHPQNPDYTVVDVDINVYHLKHIRPELREQRRNLYERLDPSHAFQAVGYEYLTDEQGIRLKTIAPWRMYRPPYRDYRIDDGIFQQAGDPGL